MTLVNSAREVWGRVRRSIPAPPTQRSKDVDAFVQAGQEEAAERRAPVSPAAGLSWSPVEPGDDRARAKRFGRGLVWFVLAILAFVGLRTMFFPSDPASTPAARPSAVGSGFPQQDAQAVAQRWTTNYLGYDSSNQDTEDARTKALAQDTAPDVDLDNAWNQTGSQHVVAVMPGQVRVTSATAATVTVYARVAPGPAQDSSQPPSTAPTPTPKSTPSDKPKSKPTPKKSSKPSSTAPAKPKKKADAGTGTVQVVPVADTSSATSDESASSNDDAGWIALSLPMGWDGERPVVDGLPAFVGMPQAGTAKSAPGQDAPQADSALSASTRSGAEAFFRAYAGTDVAALDAVAAPGAHVAPLGGQVQFGGLQNWTVYTGSGSSAKSGVSATRTAQAVVVWRLSGDAQLTQAYDVRLENVTGSGASAWRVADVSVNTHKTQ